MGSENLGLCRNACLHASEVVQACAFAAVCQAMPHFPQNRDTFRSEPMESCAAMSMDAVERCVVDLTQCCYAFVVDHDWGKHGKTS